MDLGFGLDGEDVPVERQQAARRAAVGSSGRELQRTVETLTKLTLSNAQQIRGMRSILLDCYRLPADAQLVVAAKAATQAYAEKARKIENAADRYERIGLPHLHAWNGCIRAYKAALEAGGAAAKPKLDALLGLLEKTRAEGGKIVMEHVPYCRVRKTFNRDYMNLEIHVMRGTHSRGIYEMVREWVLSLKGAAQLPGTAPPGDLGRKLQEWLEANGASNKAANGSMET